MNAIHYMLWNEVHLRTGRDLRDASLIRVIEQLNVRYVVHLKMAIFTSRFLTLTPTMVESVIERFDATKQKGRILFTYADHALFVSRYLYDRLPHHIDLDHSVSEILTLEDGEGDAGVNATLCALTTQSPQLLAPYSDQIFDLCQRIENHRLDEARQNLTSCSNSESHETPSQSITK